MQDHIVKDIEIKSHLDFVQTTNFFDIAYGSTTYVGYDTISTMLKKFPLDSANDFNLNEHNAITQNINYVFSHFNIFDIKNYQDFKDKRAIRFFNHIYCLLCDIKQGKPLISPFSITRYPNGQNFLHPGAKRILLHNVYHDPIKYIVTDFTHNPLKIYNFKTFNFDWSVGDYWISYRYRKNIMHKELFGVPKTNKRNDFISVEYVTDRIFEYTGNTVRVNDVNIMKKQNGVWRVVLE